MDTWRIAQFYDRLMLLRFASGETRKLRDLFAEFLFLTLPEEMQEERRALDPNSYLPLNQPAPAGSVEAGGLAAQPGVQIHSSKNVRIMAPPPGAVPGPVTLPQQPPQLVQRPGAHATQARPGAIMDGNTLLSGSVQTHGGQHVKIIPAPGSAAQLAAMAIAQGEPVPAATQRPVPQPTDPVPAPAPVSRTIAGPTIHNPEPSPDAGGDTSSEPSSAELAPEEGSDSSTADLSLDALLELAIALEIKGSSKLKREELVDAIALAQAGADDGSDEAAPAAGSSDSGASG